MKRPFQGWWLFMNILRIQNKQRLSGSLNLAPMVVGVGGKKESSKSGTLFRKYFECFLAHWLWNLTPLKSRSKGFGCGEGKKMFIRHNQICKCIASHPFSGRIKKTVRKKVWGNRISVVAFPVKNTKKQVWNPFLFLNNKKKSVLVKRVKNWAKEGALIFFPAWFGTRLENWKLRWEEVGKGGLTLDGHLIWIMWPHGSGATLGPPPSCVSPLLFLHHVNEWG